MDRILSLADRQTPLFPKHRPPYRYQVPLEFLPGLGKKKLQALLAVFGTEMNILHRVTYEELAEQAGPEIAEMIVKAREGNLELQAGGGGKYGKVKS